MAHRVPVLVDDLMDPDKLAEHTVRRRRATGVALASGFGVAVVAFWPAAYLSEADLELLALAALNLGALVALVVWWTQAPKKLKFEFDVPAEPDDAALAALSDGFVAPLADDVAPPSTGSVSDAEIAEAASEARAAQVRAALRIIATLGATFVCFALGFYVLEIQLQMGMSAVTYALVPAVFVGYLVNQRMGRATEVVGAVDVFQFASTLAIADSVEVVRSNGILTSFASRFGITLGERHEIRSGGGYLASVAPSEMTWFSRVVSLLPLLARTEFRVLEFERTQLNVCGSWHLSVPLMPDRVQVEDASSETVGAVARPFGRLRYELHVEGAEPVRLQRSGLSSIFRATDADGEIAALEVFRPSFFQRWFFGPFAGERGVRVRFGSALTEPARQLLLVAAIHLDRSI